MNILLLPHEGEMQLTMAIRDYLTGLQIHAKAKQFERLYYTTVNISAFQTILVADHHGVKVLNLLD